MRASLVPRLQLTSESGVSLTELVIAIPIVLLMVGTLIDFGLATQRGEVIAEIAKQAARTAAIVSFEDDGRPSASKYVCLPSGPQKCTEDGGWKLIERLADESVQNDCSSETFPSLDCLTATEAYSALSASGLEAKDWVVRARTCDYGVDSLPVLGIQVGIERSPLAKSCFICLGQYLAANFARASSLFAVEGECDT